MSGVFGIVDRDKGRDWPGLLQEMGQKMSHERWFQVDTFRDPDRGIGLGRVGIGTFNPEPQPVSSEDNNLHLFLSGEFYDIEETCRELEHKGYTLRDESHAELALRLYQEGGIERVTQLEGVFVLAVWDRRSGTLYIANDRFGLKPLYYARHDDRFIFSPELKGILADGTIKKKLDMSALAEYLRFQMVLGDKTFFEDVYLLAPATVLQVDCESLLERQHHYWDWRNIVLGNNTSDDGEIVEETIRILRRAVNMRVERAGKPGVFLSGGLDSRMILALIERPSKQVKTITYGRRDSRDVHLAGKVARTLGTSHHHFELPDGNWVKEIADIHVRLVEGAHSWVHAHGLSIAPQVRRLIDVNLSGIGGGTLLGATYAMPANIYAPDDEAYVAAMFHYYTQVHTWPGLQEAEAYRLFSNSNRSNLPELAYESLRYELSRYDHPDIYLRGQFFYINNHNRRFIANHLVFANAYYENRCPFYDYQLVQWLVGIPLELKQGRKLQKSILSRIAPKLTLIPYEKDYRLPTNNRLLWSIHAGFSKILPIIGQSTGRYTPLATLYADYENYLRHELCEWGEEILFNGPLLDSGILRQEALRSLWKRHLSGKEEWTIGKIAPIMSYAMFLKEFYTEEWQAAPA